MPGAAREAREERQSASRERRIAERARVLSELLHERSDLAGVYGPADLVAESVRWCA